MGDLTPADYAELEGKLERERAARKAVERVNAEEVLARRTNLEARIASETARAEDAEARAERVEAALQEALALIEKTIYHPPGWTGPDVWWADEARALLARREARDEVPRCAPCEGVDDPQMPHNTDAPYCSRREVRDG